MFFGWVGEEGCTRGVAQATSRCVPDSVRALQLWTTECSRLASNPCFQLQVPRFWLNPETAPRDNSKVGGHSHSHLQPLLCAAPGVTSYQTRQGRPRGGKTGALGYDTASRPQQLRARPPGGRGPRKEPLMNYKGLVLAAAWRAFFKVGFLGL